MCSKVITKMLLTTLLCLLTVTGIQSVAEQLNRTIINDEIDTLKTIMTGDETKEIVKKLLQTALDCKNEYAIKTIFKKLDQKKTITSFDDQEIQFLYNTYTANVDVINQTINEITPKTKNMALMLAASKGYTNIIEILVEKNANLEDINCNNENALLIALVASKEAAAAKILTYDKINVKKKNNKGWTALTIAAGKGYTSIVETLLKKGSDVNDSDTDGDTAIIIAAEYGHSETITLLLNNQANINASNNNGNTALHEAVLNDRADAVAALVNFGLEDDQVETVFDALDINKTNTDGNTALDLLTNEESDSTKQIKALLLDADAMKSNIPNPDEVVSINTATSPLKKTVIPAVATTSLKQANTTQTVATAKDTIPSIKESDMTQAILTAIGVTAGIVPIAVSLCSKNYRVGTKELFKSSKRLLSKEEKKIITILKVIYGLSGMTLLTTLVAYIVNNNQKIRKNAQHKTK